MKKNLLSAGMLAIVLVIGLIIGSHISGLNEPADSRDSGDSGAPTGRIESQEGAKDQGVEGLIGRAARAPAGMPGEPPVPAVASTKEAPRRAHEEQRRQAFHGEIVRRTARLYDAFAASSGLDGETYARVLELITSRQIEGMNQFGRRARLEGGNPPSREEIQAYRAETTRLLSEVLDPDQFQEYQEYAETIPDRAVLGMVRSVDSAVEITPEVESEVVGILQRARQSAFEGGRPANAQEAFAAQSNALNQALEETSGILSPEAQAALSEVAAFISSPRMSSGGGH